MYKRRLNLESELNNAYTKRRLDKKLNFNKKFWSKLNL